MKSSGERSRGATGFAPVALAALLAVLVAFVLTGCAAPGGGAPVHSDVARCAAVLPMARDVVHGQGTLTVVRPVDRADVDALTREAGVDSPPAPVSKPPASPKPPRPPEPSQNEAGPPLPKACLIVYRGNYPAGSIPSALPPAHAGQYALIVVKVRHPAVDRVLVTETLPASAARSWWHF
jgi:hypothetical protein